MSVGSSNEMATAIFWSSSIVLYVVTGWNWLKHLQSTASKFWNFLECSRTTKRSKKGGNRLFIWSLWHLIVKASALDRTAEFSVTCPTLHRWKGKITRNLRLSQVSRHLIFLAWNPMHMRNLREQHLTMRLWAEKGIVWSMMKSEVVPKYSAKPNVWSFYPQTNFPNPTSKSMRVSICHLGPRSVLPRSISTDELHTFFLMQYTAATSDCKSGFRTFKRRLPVDMQGLPSAAKRFIVGQDRTHAKA